MRRDDHAPFGRRLRRAGSFSTDATTSASRTRRYAPNTCDAVQAAGCVCAGCQCERRLFNDSNVTDAVAAPTCGSDADDPLYEAATTFVSCTVSECPDWLEDDDDSVDDGDDDEPRSCEEVAPYVDDACAVALLVDGVDECGSCGKEYSRYAACSLEFQAHSLGLGCDLTSTDCESYLVDSGTRVGAALLAGALAAAATLS